MDSEKRRLRYMEILADLRAGKIGEQAARSMLADIGADESAILDGINAAMDRLDLNEIPGPAET